MTILLLCYNLLSSVYNFEYILVWEIITNMKYQSFLKSVLPQRIKTGTKEVLEYVLIINNFNQLYLSNSTEVKI